MVVPKRPVRKRLSEIKEHNKLVKRYNDIDLHPEFNKLDIQRMEALSRLLKKRKKKV